MDPLVLTFDMGTQSLRASLVNDKGEILKAVSRRFSPAYFSLQRDWAEQRGEFYRDHLGDASKELKSIAGEEMWSRIQAVTLTTFRDSDICLDINGDPVRPAILWLDKREVNMKGSIGWWRYAVFAVAGALPIIKYVRRICHCNYIRQEEPENWAKTYKFMMISGYLNFCLTGEMKDSAANMIGHFSYDTKKMRWQSPSSLTYPVYPIPKEKQPELVEPGQIIGHISEKGEALTLIPRGTPLIATGSDKGCESIGLGCITPDKAAISFGTAATISYTLDHYVAPKTFFPAYPSPCKGLYNDEFQVYRGYWMLRWFFAELGRKEADEARGRGLEPEELMDAHLSSVPAGAEGLIVQPYFTDGIDMPNARGSMVGFSDVHTRFHVYRAIVEGVNYALMVGRDNLEKRTKTKAKELYLSGGGSSSKEICQITADMFGLPCHLVQTREASTLGASLVAFMSMGRFEDLEEAVESMVHVTETFEPDPQVHAFYDRMYKNVYRKIFRRLQPLFRETKGILRKK